MIIDVLECYADGRQVLETVEVPDDYFAEQEEQLPENEE